MLPVHRDEDGVPIGTSEELSQAFGPASWWNGDEPPPKQKRFLEEWCLVYPRPCTQKEMAQRLGVTDRTVRKWMVDPRFRALWRDKAEDGYASPEMTQPLVAETYRLALNEPDAEGKRSVSPSDQLRAIETFAKFVDMTTPQTIRHEVVPLDRTLEKMSIEELTGIIEAEGREVTDDR